MGSQILIVDDDSEIRELVAMYLHEHGLRTIEAEDGQVAVQQFIKYRPDLILLDIIMPEMNGFEVCRRIRELSKVPIIFLTSKRESEDIIRGLECGGDDYVIKPFLPDVLIARVKAKLRRSGLDKPHDVLVYDGLQINKDTFEVYHGEKVIPFLAKEVKILMFLAERPKQVFSAEQLYDSIWDYAGGDARTVMVHISNIRKKLKQYAPNTVAIETLKGIGYRFVQAPYVKERHHVDQRRHY